MVIGECFSSTVATYLSQTVKIYLSQSSTLRNRPFEEEEEEGHLGLEMVCGEFVAPPLSRSNRPRWGDTDRGQMAGGRFGKM